MNCFSLRVGKKVLVTLTQGDLKFPMNLRRYFLAATLLIIINKGQFLSQEISFLPTSASNVVAHFGDSDAASTDLIVNVDLVNVPFTVRDGGGRLVTEVDPGYLRIYEDNQLQAIRNFSREVNLPLTIGLLVDTSNSIRERWSFERATAQEFLNKTIKAGHDSAFLMSFDSRIRLIQDYTDDPVQLAGALCQLRPSGATKLFDAVVQACQDKMAPVEGRKVLIIISDGDDNASLLNLRKALKTAQNHDVLIYSVSTNPYVSCDKHLDKPDKILRSLALETGGQAFFPTTTQEFARSFESISAELRSQFSLAYNSTNARRDGVFRKIRIVSDQKKWVVRTRKGYFAPTG